MKVFVSCSFDPTTENVIDLAKSIFKFCRIDAFISGGVEPHSISESVRKHIRGSDAFLVILTKRESAWVQNEIGIAFDAGIPIYAIAQKDIEVKGILSQITIYERFDLKSSLSVATAIGRVAEKISESKTEDEIGEIYKMFKNKRERIIFKLGTHAASEQLYLSLLLKNVSPIFFKTYQEYHHNEAGRYQKELEQLL